MKENRKRKEAPATEESPIFGFINWDILNRTVTVCPYIVKTLAFKTKNEEQTHSDFLALVHPEDLANVENAIKSVLEKKTSYILIESRRLCRDGTWRWFCCRGKVVAFDMNGNPLHVTGMCTDITDIKESKIKIQQTKLLFSKINTLKELLKEGASLHDICTEIAQCFAKLTLSSNVYFTFSSTIQTYNFNLNDIVLHDLNGQLIDNATLSIKYIKLIKTLFHEKKNIIKNQEKSCQFGIYFDLPFSQQGALIIEREAPFDTKMLDFLEPLIDASTHIVSIKKLQENSSELDNILSFFIKQVPAPVAMFDKNMCYKFASNAWCKSFQHSEEELIGKSHYDIYPNIPQSWIDRHKRALKGESIEYHANLAAHILKKPIWVEGCIYPWYTLNGEIGGIVIYSNNITEQIEFEKKMETIVDNLSRSNQALDRFAHVCSHDLKEPLRTIGNFIQLLFSRNSESFDEESLLYVRHILKGIDRMSTLIKDILSYSETNNIVTEKEQINLNHLIDEIKESFNYQLSEINARLNIGSLPDISGIKTKIYQLFANLISNAIKFRSAAPLSIDIFAEEHNEFWEFHLRDNGIGIAPEYQKTIFNMFKRLHSKNKYEGSGIGLATCQKIVHEHQGEIYVQSIPEGGSDFIFTLPKATTY